MTESVVAVACAGFGKGLLW